jgi:peptidyl-prolyl cis-trans isomerase B (cyclophilin B)
MSLRRALVLALVAALALAAGCGGDDEPADEEAVGTTAATAAETGCRDVEAPQPRPEGTLEAPTAILNVEQTHRVHVTTSCGEFTITLDPKASPRAASAFAALVERRFFDRTVFHRIVPGFVIQGGDPTGTGTGGPGFSTVDTPTAGTTYERGVVAMAKTPSEAPGTAGSQFFIVTADDARLPAEYAVIGRVTDGLDVVMRIAVLGDPNTELPTQPVVVETMTLETSG